MSNDYQCHIFINNRSSEHLRLLKKETNWGEFREGPMADIGPHAEEKAFVATGSTGPAGTEGSVVYQVGDDANTTISIAFDIPSTSSKNTLRVVTSDSDIAAQVSGFYGEGASEACLVRVVDGRE